MIKATFRRATRDEFFAALRQRAARDLPVPVAAHRLTVHHYAADGELIATADYGGVRKATYHIKYSH